MTRLSNANLETLRNRPQQTKLHLSIFQPQAIFKARINYPNIPEGEREINYDTVSLGSYTAIESGMTMWVGTTPGGMELGKIRVRSATATEIKVSENSDIDWQDNAYLTVFRYWELWPVFPRIIQDPADDENVIFYKDYDIDYTNQNSILGTFVNIGPNRAAYLDPASGQTQLFWTSTGTYNLLGNALSYSWFFEGATVTGSTSANPGYITYNNPGYYTTRLIVSGSNGAVDKTYRHVSIYNSANPPIQKWQLTALNGSRDEGGYTASFRVFEAVPLQEHAIVVLFGDNWYGDTQANLGGNYPNGGGIFWAGHVDKDSIQYDYQHSELTFDAHSITQMMKESSGFSVSVESKSNPQYWYELLDMDGRRALYHYLRWHTTALNIADFQFVGTDYPIQFFDSDRESMYDALDNFMRDTLIGQVVADRQGKVWMEVEAMAYSNPTGTFTPVMQITNRDWMNEPSIEERLSEELAFLEMGGIAYSGVTTGSFSAILAAAPGNAPGFHGSIETHEGLALGSQTQLNQLVGNVFANKNSPFPSVDMEMSINTSNLDIAPQETVGLNILASDTVRNIPINGLYLPNGMEWTYSSQDLILLSGINFKELVSGDTGETIVVVQPEDVGGGFNVPGLQIPPLPPITFPPFALTNTGSSCCDYFENLGAGLGPFCCVVISNRTTLGGCQVLGDNTVTPIQIDYASNMAMYDPVTRRINFINTGAMTFDFSILSSFYATAGRCGGQILPILYNGTTNNPIIDGPGYPLSQAGITAQGALFVGRGCQDSITTAGDPSDVMPPAFTTRLFRSDFKAPNYIQLFSEPGTCGTNEDNDCTPSVCDETAVYGFQGTRFSVCAVQ